MTSTSDAVTAPIASGTASGPVRSAGSIAHGWRVLRTARRFFRFGLGAIVVAPVVVVVPEGTRSPRGGLRRFQRGAAHIALKSGCPVVPIVITCRPPTLLKGQPWHEVPDRRADWVLRVGDPIDPARYLNTETTLPV